MRTERQHRIDRALVRTLRQTSPLLLREKTLRDEIALGTDPAATNDEITEAIRHADGEGRLTTVRGETGLKYKLNDNGHAWAAENNL